MIVTGRKKPRLRVRLFLAIDKIGEWLVHGSILSFVYTFTNHSPTICDGLPMVFCIIFFQIFQGAIGRAIPAIPLVWSDPTRSVCNKQEAVVTLYDKGSMGEDGPIRPCYATLLLRGLEPHMLELWFGSDYKFSESVIRARTWSRWLPSSLRNCYITIYFIWCELIISNLCIVCFGAHQENPFLFRAPWHPSASWLSCAGEVWSP